MEVKIINTCISMFLWCYFPQNNLFKLSYTSKILFPKPLEHSSRQDPAGTWRKYNVASTSMQCHDVASMLRRRYIYVMCPLGRWYLISPWKHVVDTLNGTWPIFYNYMLVYKILIQFTNLFKSYGTETFFFSKLKKGNNSQNHWWILP